MVWYSEYLFCIDYYLIIILSAIGRNNEQLMWSNIVVKRPVDRKVLKIAGFISFLGALHYCSLTLIASKETSCSNR
jgi:hypothetical protein